MIAFVYVRGLKGPEPQLWHEAPTNGAGLSTRPLQSVELPDAYAALRLDELVKHYPYKGASDDT